ncbi:hypothetical protein Tco_0514723 [Tanacetum coccineum]
MMQRLLPYGLQQYLPDEVAKPIIELYSFFKQICSSTLMEDDMLKSQNKVVDILCNLELIYPPGFFDIMIHLVIHLPLEALEGGPIRPRWMFPFERFMKKLKGYVRNKAKPEGLIAEGYIAEEALTFSSHYFRDVTTKFNRPDRNVDPPPPTSREMLLTDGVWGGLWSWRIPPRGRALDLIIYGTLGESLQEVPFPPFPISRTLLWPKVGSWAIIFSNKKIHGVFQCVNWAVWKWRNKVVNAPSDSILDAKFEDIYIPCLSTPLEVLNFS